MKRELNDNILMILGLVILFVDHEITFKLHHSLLPAFAAMHGLHSLVRFGPGCADRA